MNHKQKGFTLVELLVVIAIIALLISILMPALQKAQKAAQSVKCLANLRGLSMAYYTYSEEHDGLLPLPGTQSGHWVDRPTGGDSSTLEQKKEAIAKGTLYEYAGGIRSFKDTNNRYAYSDIGVTLYHCPGDTRFRQNITNTVTGGYRSYSMPGVAPRQEGKTLSNSPFDGPVFSAKKYEHLNAPADVFIFVEENYTTGSNGTTPRGFNLHEWNLWRDGNFNNWWDPLAPFHGKSSNLGFADGHAKGWVWQDPETIQFAHDRNSNWDGQFNPDREFISFKFPIHHR